MGVSYHISYVHHTVRYRVLRLLYAYVMIPAVGIIRLYNILLFALCSLGTKNKRSRNIIYLYYKRKKKRRRSFFLKHGSTTGSLILSYGVLVCVYHVLYHSTVCIRLEQYGVSVGRKIRYHRHFFVRVYVGVCHLFWLERDRKAHYLLFVDVFLVFQR